MDHFLKFLSVFFTSMLELWAAIPLGFAMKMDPVLNALASASGAVTGAAIVIFGGEKIRRLLDKSGGVKTGNPDKPGRKNTAKKIWERYGVIGLGLLAPWITGAPLGAALGMGLKADAKQLLFWITAGVVICDAVFVLAGTLGIKALAG